MSPSDFSDKTAIVTGAAHGFGRAICTALAAQGAHVWALDIAGDELAQTVQLCRDTQGGGNCQARVVDITSADAVRALVQEVCATARSTSSSTTPVACSARSAVRWKPSRPSSGTPSWR
jgi:NAD(P)-dependent dehydrogenase (short-subunit alcohol dehydrogenase family)